MLRCAVCDGLFETLKAWRKHKREVIKHQDLIKKAFKFDYYYDYALISGQSPSSSSCDSFLDLNRPNYGDKKLYSRGEYGIPILESGKGWMRKKGGAKKR